MLPVCYDDGQDLSTKLFVVCIIKAPSRHKREDVNGLRERARQERVAAANLETRAFLLFFLSPRASTRSLGYLFSRDDGNLAFDCEPVEDGCCERHDNEHDDIEQGTRKETQSFQSVRPEIH